MARLPAVAGRFYPADPVELSYEVRKLTGRLRPTGKRPLQLSAPMQAICIPENWPPRQYVRYSFLRPLSFWDPIITASGVPVALSTSVWKMPGGDVPVNLDLARAIMAGSSLVKWMKMPTVGTFTRSANSLFFRKCRRICPSSPWSFPISPIRCAKKSPLPWHAIMRTGKDVLIVASTDMTHYESRQVAGRKGRPCT